MSTDDQSTDIAGELANSGYPTKDLNDTVHQRHRLGILTIASETERVEVAYLKDALELTPGNLSRHLIVLEEANLIHIEKGYHGRRPKTWIRITQQGQEALDAEINALRELLHRHQSRTPG